MPELALPIQGYDNQIDSTDYALPVAQPIPTDIPRVYINKPEPKDQDKLYFNHESGNILKAVDHDPWANLGMAGVEDKSGQSEHPLLKQLFGLGGESRVQLWPERMVRAGVTAAGNVMSGQTPQWAVDPETGDVHTSPQMIEAGLDTAALAGTGGLAGTTEATLGSGPFLRPALKHNGKIYKGKEGQQHLDVLPKELEADFNQKAMTGEDISHYNFGFMNHKGQFLNREAALDYAVKEGLVDPTAGQYGALTSTLLSDSSKPGIAIEAMKKPTFYSALEHNVNNIGQAKMTGDQWLGTLANKSGVKPEELQWTGLKDFLEENKGKVVTKEAIQQHLEQNKISLSEVTKGNPPSWDKLSGEEQYAFLDKYKDQGANPHNVRDIYEEVMSDVENHPTKYHDYQLPGSENYREMLMTLPSKAQTYKNIKTGKMQKVYGDPADYESSHWNEPNILAHIRMNDRTIEGKKSLHLEEIQSDWHQQGREKGYINPKRAEEAKSIMAEMNNHRLGSPEYEKLSSKLDTLENNPSGVPDAPFKKTWHELALKRMLREAAEKGYDRLSWTPGEAQAARYDLSKSVDKIAVPMVNDNGTRSVRIDNKGSTPFKLMVDKSGKVEGMAGSSDQFSGKSLSDIVGKEMADKIMKLDKPNEFAGEGLKIGGEGMKGFYDKMIPNALEKMGKEHGVKVKSAKITEHEAYVGQGRNGPETIPKKENTVHYIDIPQSLKDTVLHKGQPLFSSAHPGITFSQVDHDPWEKKNAIK